ncbi:MAG: magnesium transporter [Gemmatimonadales bacterium]|nr:MAG: magnesium transporter [Gemmatimonadales bacterium]
MQLQDTREPEIRRYIEGRDWTRLRELLADLPPADLADLLLDLGKKERVLVFRAIPRDPAAEAFAHLDPDQQELLLRDLTDEETRHLLEDLHPDDRTALLEELPGTVTQQLMNLLSPEDLQEARALLGYPEESVGRLMTPDYVAVRKHWTAEQALRQVRRKGEIAETVNRVFIVDEDWKLIDDIALRRLILAEPEDLVESVMDHTFAAVPATADREEAVRMIQRYDQVALPVVDSNGVLVGIVTVDDVLDVAQEEATEDFHKLGSTLPVRIGLKEASIAVLYRARIGWLMILVFMNIFSGAGIAYFEDTLEAMIALAFFLPLLIDSGGNAGSQSATLMVRAIAIGDVRLKDWFGMLGKELTVAVILGATMALGVAAIASFRAPEIIVVVSLTMMLIVMVGSIIGMSLPFLLTRFGLDPATASAPLITSISDICGVLIYFSIASWYLGIG